MARRRSRTPKQAAAEGWTNASSFKKHFREEMGTQDFRTQDFNTQQLGPQTQPIDTEALGRAIGDALKSSLTSGSIPSISGAMPAVGGMGGGAQGPPHVTGWSPIGPEQQSGWRSPGALANEQAIFSGGPQSEAPAAFAQGIQGATRALGTLGAIGTGIDRALGRSGLETTGPQAIREYIAGGNAFPDWIRAVGAQGGPITQGLANFGAGAVDKVNQFQNAASGLTALQISRAQLASIAGGLSQRGARFSDKQLEDALDVFVHRNQADLDTQIRVSRIADAYGARRSGLGSAGLAR
jgi:hypothetical protein